MSDLTKRLAALTPMQRALLLQRARKEQENGEKNLTVLRIVPQERGAGAVLLSFAQERLWFLDQFEPLSTAYTIPSVLRIHGALSLEVLQRSFSKVVQRHESLRTIFTSHEGHPAQVIVPFQPPVVPVIDLRDCREDQREESVEQIIQQEMLQPFDLATGPLLRVHLLWLNLQEYTLILSMHHIISDGWSMNVLIHELSLLYYATIQEKVSPLPPLPIQYADYALWQRKMLQGETRQRLLDYWQQQLTGAPQILNLPTDHPRPVIQSSSGVTFRNVLPLALLQQLQALSLHEGVTLFMTLLASFQVLLMRYSGQSDIVVGTSIANRTRGEVESLIGFFVNTLVLRTDLSGNPDFRQLLARVRRVTQQAYAHQDLPFEQLVEALQPERSLSHTPIFQVLFTLQNLPVTQLDLAGLTWHMIDIARTEAKFDLALTLSEGTDGLHVRFVYRADLFEADTIERLFQHWQQMLAAIVVDPTIRVTHLPLLTPAEQQFLLHTINQTRAPVLAELGLHEYIQQQVQHTPDAIAVVSQEEQLSYAALNGRANQLARLLCVHGVRGETPIGIFLEPLPHLVVAVLAVLKAGAMYVPLDPAHPAGRLQMVLDDAAIRLVLTQKSLLEYVNHEGVMCWCLDLDWPQTVNIADENLDLQVAANQAAYLLYTSGSTGKPKGVLIEHRNIINYVQAVNERADLSIPGVSALVQPLSADSSLTMLFPSLVNGGTLHLINRERVLDQQALIEDFTRYPVDYLKITPSHFHALLTGIDSRRLLPRRQLIIGGEGSQWQWVQQICAHLPDGAALYNHYGPTETTVGSLMYRVSVDADRHAGVLTPIGTPLLNTQIYVLDAELQPVPTRVIGELFIGGMGLARGYFGHPDLTADSFVPDPFSGEQGARLYRTGDLVRYRADGIVEFVGRNDGQVKIRGYRVEIGEIEATLRGHGGVHEAAVVVQDTPTGGKRLVAYLTTRQQTPISAPELQLFLRARLPDPLIPSLFVWLDALPLIAHGKIDRSALCALKVEEEEQTLPESVSPRNETEAILVRIWSQVLRRSQMSIYDNFFALGGDSILSIQVVARARQAGLHLTPKQIFQGQTIAQLAILAAESGPQVSEVEHVAGPVPLTPIQQRFFAQNLSQPHYYNQAVLLQVPASWDLTLIRRIFEAIVVQHAALRLRFRSGTDGWEQRLLDMNAAGLVAVERIDLSSLPATEQPVALQTEINRVQASLNFEDGPLLRAALFHLDSQQPGRLLIVLHHLAVDGVSWRVILEDLQIASTQLQRGEIVSLPPKTASFPHWAHSLQSLANSSLLRQDRDYWLTVAQEETQPLPVDMPGGKNTVEVVRSVSKTLTVEETRLLLQEAPRPYRSQIQELLLVAVLKALHGWTKNQKVRLDLEGHGREDLADTGVDISRTVGWFTSVYPLLFQLPQTADSGVWIKTVKEQLRSVPHKGMGYGLLRYIHGDQSIVDLLQAASPSQVIFNYLGQFDQIADVSTERELRLAPESNGSTRGAFNARAYLLEVTGQVIGGQLRLTWSYSTQLHRQETIEALAQDCVQIVRDLLTHCLSNDAGGYTPSDFPLAHLNQETLDRLVMYQPPIEDIYPLTPLQQGLLFHTLYAPQGGAYVEQLWATMQALNQPAFERVWSQIIAQHAILRTSVVWQELDEPLQIVWEHAGASISTLDWSDHTEEQQQEYLQVFLQEDRIRGFDLQRAPLMRLALIRLNEKQTQLIWSRHHLIQDGWSSSMLMQEVFASYDAYVHGRQWQPEPRRPYRDYLVWLQKQNVQEAQEYWRTVLAGLQSPTPLGIDRRSSPVASERDYAEERLWLTAETTARWLALTRQQQLTLNTLIQGAWAVVLSHYSGHSDVLFGNVVAGRPPELVGVERMVGVFINTLPARISLNGDDNIGNWLKFLQEQQAEHRQYEYSSLVQVQGSSEIPRDLPLFESLFVFENYPVEGALNEQQGTLIVDAVLTREQTNYPLTIVIAPGRKLRFSVRYELQRFSSSVMQRLLQHLRVVSEQMLEHPERRLADLTLLTYEERRQLLETWNNTQVKYEQEQMLHRLFEQQAERVPDVIALIFEGTSLTYRELNNRANRLAHFLHRSGIRSDDLVGLCMDRSLEMIIGMLGILKAGGAFVPLDPTYPQERLNVILEDCRPAITLVPTRLQQIFFSPLLTHTQIVSLNEVWDNTRNEPSKNLDSDISSDYLAYVIYTSGSTGRPKGAMNTHRGICNRLFFQCSIYRLALEDRVLQKTPFSFDVSVWEVFWPLMAGACLVIARPEGHQDPAYVQQIMLEEEITIVHFVPAMLQAFLQEPGVERCVHVHQVFSSGEALTKELQERFFAHFPSLSVSLYNMYGPAEAAIEVTLWKCRHEADQESVPIGFPITNTQLYILDADLQPVPIGVPGELHIGGVGLARGYCNRPALTAEKFIAHPFSAESGARLYKTGDQARYRADGAIEFIGRLDTQVKLRGYRIELGEIESVLRAHPQVLDAIVLLWEASASRKYLAAYIVPTAASNLTTTNTTEQLTARALRTYVQEQLADYMVPANFVFLKRLPVTTNGKVDRRALPAPDAMPLEQDTAFVAPRTPLEELLAQIWEQVLDCAQISIHENFFALGGHSLLATQVVSRIRQVLQMELPLRTLFEAPTIVELAQWIETQRYKQSYEAIPAIVPVERAAESELSFAQERLWFLYQLESHNAFYTMSSVLHPVGHLSVAALERSLAAIVQRHEILRTTFVVRHDQPVQVIAPEQTAVYPQGEINISPYQMPIIDLSGLDGAERELQARILLQQEERLPFDLAVGPLLRSRLLRLSEQDHILVFLMHHIISDGWSMGVLTRELSELYQASLYGDPSPLPSLVLQYADYAHWQRHWLQGEVLQAQLDYWYQQLEDAPELLNLPTDRPRPALQSYVGSREVLILPPYLSQALMALSQREGVTLYMTLLAAYQVLLLRYSGQSDILVGTPIANRTRGEVENLIGFFVNTLVMRTDLSGNPGFRQLLARVREVALGAFAHQDLPFEKLVDALQIERSSSYAPLFQVFFALQNAPQTDIHLPDLSFVPASLEHTTAKFDLAFDLRMTNQGLRTSVEYVSALFDAATIQRLLGHWQMLLEAIVSDPDQPIEQLPLLSPPEWEPLRVRWNATDGVYRPAVCLHQLFEQQVERVPDAIALSFEEQSLTYRELNQRANQLAHHLRTLGVAAEVPVGICVERSPEMVIGLLAILKVGGAFLPLDPTYPKVRLAFMLEDAHPLVVLTQTHLQDVLSSSLMTQMFYLDTFWPHVNLDLIENPSSSISPANVAYLIYTSGSTGQPKSTMNTHQGICNNMLWKQEMCVFTSSDSIIQRAPLSFDASIEEIFLPLMSGGRLVVAHPEGQKDSAYLVSLLKEQAITALSSVPSLLQMLLEEHGILDCQHLRLVLCGGEAMPPELPARLFRRVPASLYNLYGPTEAAIQVTCWTCQRESPQEIRVPIGYPIANTQIYLLDAHLQPVPLGVAGEVYLGGMNLGRGYFKRPDVTGERFIPHPFAFKPGERLYRTGDLGRYRADGAIEYLGRVDQQVKVRGVRIELGEIEGALNQHPAVQECVVVVREDVPGDQRLIAYVVPAFDSQEVTEVASSWADEHIGQWQALYDETYRTAKDIQDPTLNIFGWNSSYTGQPIPSEEMREQIGQAVERILARGPERVLEIGCGTGLLLFRVAPHCREYVASDFSHEALEYVQQVLLTHPSPQVTLAQQQAHESLQVPPESFDAIILNSVLQYFPDIQYVVRVLTDALTALKPGGFLFLGDVRNLALQKAYCTSVVWYRAAASLTREEVRRSVQQRMLEEEELLIDPAFFFVLQRELPQIGQVQVLLKRGRAHNELTRFRYDVLLRKAATEDLEEPHTMWDWPREAMTLARLENYLRMDLPQSLHLCRVPNQRLTNELQQAAWVFGGQGPETVKEWRDEQERQPVVSEPDPEAFWILGERLGYQVTVNWSAEGEGGYCDVFFRRSQAIQVRSHTSLSSPGHATRATQWWLKYANNPLQGKMMSTLLPQLRSFLKTQLLEYVLPSHYVILESLPLTPNGKVDRRSLPVPDRGLSGSRGMFVAPQTPLQEHLAMLWTELLHVSQMSIHENFFELGGHSLLATQLMMHIRTTFQVEVPLRSLFEAPTLAQMATVIEQLQGNLLDQTEEVELEQMLSTLEGLSDDELQAVLGGEI